MIVRRFTVAVLAATLAVGACKGDPPPPPAPPAVNQDSIDAARRAEEERLARERAEAEARAREAAEREAAAARAAARETPEAMVFFDYDVSEIRSDMQQLMRQKAAILRASPQVQIRIEGHADERGSPEYHLALGNRRAEAIRDFLTGFGLSESRFEITSFGEDRPLANGSGEAAWQRNRRGEFRITAGANAINPAN